MEFLLLVILIVCSSLIACYSLYRNKDLVCRLNKKAFIATLWLINFCCLIFLCANRASMGLLFNSHAPDIDFMQTILPEYMNVFISHASCYAAFIAVYSLLQRKLKIAQPWFLAALGLLMFFIYFPGIDSADGENSYGQFLAHSYSDWQPPLFTLWWNIFRVKSAVFVLNMLTYYGGLIYISYYLRLHNKNWQNNLLVVFSFNPLLFSQLAIIWKDVAFTAFLIDCVAIYLAITLAKTAKVRFILWLTYFSWLFLACGFRINGVFAVFPLLVWGVNKLMPVTWAKKHLARWRNFASSLLILCAFGLINQLITYKVFKAEVTYAPAFSLLGDAAYIECRTNHEFKIALSYFVIADESSRDVLCEQALNEYNLDTLVNAMGGLSPTLRLPTTAAGFAATKQQWLTAVSHYPLTYLTYRARFMLNDLFFPYWYPTNGAGQLQNWLAEVAHSQHLDMKFILSFFLVAATCALLSYCCLSRNYSFGFFILLASIAQLISWYFMIPAHAARYFFWNYIASILAIVLLF